MASLFFNIPNGNEGGNKYFAIDNSLGSYFRVPTATFYRSATRGDKFSDHGANLIVFSLFIFL